jgi:hypothetical protein
MLDHLTRIVKNLDDSEKIEFEKYFIAVLKEELDPKQARRNLTRAEQAVHKVLMHLKRVKNDTSNLEGEVAALCFYYFLETLIDAGLDQFEPDDFGLKLVNRIIVRYREDEKIAEAKALIADWLQIFNQEGLFI